MVNSTEETQKSATPAVGNSPAEPVTPVGTVTTSTEAAIAKNDDGSDTASSTVPDALGRYFLFFFCVLHV